MRLLDNKDDLKYLVDNLNFKQKVERSKALIAEAYAKYGETMVVANSLGKDSVVVWDLVKKVNPKIKGFIVTTRFKPAATKKFMKEVVARYPELKIYENIEPIPDKLYETDPDKCCDILKVKPIREAIEELHVKCWATGLRCTEGRTRTDFTEVEERDKGLIKLNPILIWKEREVWEYLALYQVPVNQLYAEGYRSLGCEPCTHISNEADERAGRWIGTSKCGGECGIHTRPLKNVEGDGI
ncbi:phosphoadenylyl-sulfate reductase [Candidatus Saganbacteria bacterium CG08_land_8_20_14_0_20_45_16]|uniref:Adenosine 5'-phosphosulfate reductase n=1 Tax=Candidatus Saganbacteria bacterium CG08_land_8_20_14_0_20_45_16 TaxID=2014293 RepID=A0A2H0XWC1_UNCSA|nr:MAG: phosphoadenylyl-sulfate reductase [Candidatus Saganbacteria bacterium CG08_land_8_20_14_0_20_45_16]